jgi:hypothetical protein
VSAYYCSALKFFLCVWLAFVLMGAIFHHTKTKTFCMASILVRKKDAGKLASILFFFARKLAKKKSFCLRMMKNRQHGRCNFCEGCSYKFSTQ